MPRLNFIVEGPTEEGFVRQLLTPYLSLNDVYPYVRSVQTGRHGSKIYRGGMTNYTKAKEDIFRCLKQEPESYLTTMFDYYGLPNDFPGHAKALKESDLNKKVKILEDEIGKDINNKKFIPYIQMHEFEALLFSNINMIDESMSLYNESGSLEKLEQIMAQFNSPEHVNNSSTTAPSKRLKSIYSAYDKVFLGSLITEEIGLEKIREKCFHFNEWLTKLSNLK